MRLLRDLDTPAAELDADQQSRPAGFMPLFAVVMCSDRVRDLPALRGKVTEAIRSQRQEAGVRTCLNRRGRSDSPMKLDRRRPTPPLMVSER